MKHIPLVIIVMFFPGVAGCRKTTPPPTQHELLVSRVRSVLLANWSLEEGKDEIVISRKDPVRTHGCIGLDLAWLRHPELLGEHVEKYGVTRDYKIRLRSGPKVDLVEYARLQESNSQIKVTRDTVIQDRDFFEDSAMKSFDPHYRQLPDYYDSDLSLYRETTLHPWECIYPEEVARESESVLRALDSIFTRYPNARNRTSLSWMGI